MAETDAEIQRRAEQQASALHHLGWEVGTGAAIWARAVKDVLAAHESERQLAEQGRSDRERWDRLHSTAMLLVIAIDQVLVYEKRVRSLTGDAQLAKARASFDRAFPDAEGLRDLVTHLDEYATGTGLRQRGTHQPRLNEQAVTTFMYWTGDGGTVVNLGDRTIDLRRAARAAVDLAEAVEQARGKGLARAEREANEALRRRWPR
jgi:hypothetical protein